MDSKEEFIKFLLNGRELDNNIIQSLVVFAKQKVLDCDVSYIGLFDEFDGQIDCKVNYYINGELFGTFIRDNNVVDNFISKVFDILDNK